MPTIELLTHQISIAAFVGLIGWAAYRDIASYTIPNRVCLALIALFPAFALTAPGAAGTIDWTGHVLLAGGVMAIGFVLFALRLTGGGDVKLLTAVALWAGPSVFLQTLFVIALAGGVLSLLMFSRFRPERPRAAGVPLFAHRIAPALKVHVPYGVAIAFGGVYLAHQLAFGA